jgi:cyclohexadieny/prephenate dehydrogenase
MFERMALIGVGLIGSSIAHGARKHGLVKHIAATARSQETRTIVADQGIADSVHETGPEAVAGADLVIICTPVGAFDAVARDIGPHIAPGAIVTDVGSVKEAVVRAVSPHLADGVHLVPGHPVAGTENSGPQSGFAELFEDRWCILTPEADTDQAATDKLKDFWQALGSRVEIMTPQHHDLVLAITSHVPHLIAYNIVGTAADLETVTESEVIKFSAGGFRDFTRIAASDPTMWRDVFLNNKEAVLEMLGRFNEDLSALQRAIRWDDGDALFNLFSHTREIRREIIDAGQETEAADFGRPHGTETGNEDSDENSDENSDETGD